MKWGPTAAWRQQQYDDKDKDEASQAPVSIATTSAASESATVTAPSIFHDRVTTASCEAQALCDFCTTQPVVLQHCTTHGPSWHQAARLSDSAACHYTFSRCSLSVFITPFMWRFVYNPVLDRLSVYRDISAFVCAFWRYIGAKCTTKYDSWAVLTMNIVSNTKQQETPWSIINDMGSAG